MAPSFQIDQLDLVITVTVREEIILKSWQDLLEVANTFDYKETHIRHKVEDNSSIENRKGK